MKFFYFGLLFAALSAFTNFAQASAEDYCDSLSRLSCSPGELNDGTGVALSERDYQAKVDSVSEKLMPAYESAFLKMLQESDTESQVVRALAIKAAQQNASSDCNSQDQKDQKNCNERVASMVASNAVKRIFLVSASQGAPIDLPGDGNYDELRANALYWKSLSEANTQSLTVVSEKELDQKIRDVITPNVKEILIEKVTNSVSNVVLRDTLVKKIQDVRYLGNNYSFLNKNMAPTMDGLMVGSENYSPDQNAFIFGNGFLFKSSSEFMMVYFVAHEIAHSMDPCNIGASKDFPFEYDYQSVLKVEDLEKQNPFSNVISCLRTEQSVGAKYRKYDDFLSFKKSMEDAGLPVGNNPFCIHDQITESFADWMAGEVLPEYVVRHFSALSQSQRLNGYANTTRLMCKAIAPQNGYDDHPDTQARLERILMANPKSRELVGCGPPRNDLHYCSMGTNCTGTRLPATPETGAY